MSGYVNGVFQGDLINGMDPMDYYNGVNANNGSSGSQGSSGDIGGTIDSNPNNVAIPNLGDPGAQNGQGMFTSSSGGYGTFGSGSDLASGQGAWNGSNGGSGSFNDAGGYAEGPSGNSNPLTYSGSYDMAGGSTGGYGGGYGGNNFVSGSGSTGQVNYGGYAPSGGYAPGQGLQQYPDSSNTYGQSNMGTTGGGAGQYSSGNQPLGSTTQGRPNVGQISTAFDPNSKTNPFNQATPWNGGPTSMFGKTGFQPGAQMNPGLMNQYGSVASNTTGALNAAQGANKPYQGGAGTALSGAGFQGGGAGNPMNAAQGAGFTPGKADLNGALGTTGFQGGGAGQLNPSMLQQYQGMMQNPLGGLQTAQNSSNPYQGGPQNYLTMSGFNPQQAGLNPSMGAAGFKQGGIGGPDQTAYNRYQGMLSDPTSMSANPAYKAIMDASLQATQRAGLAQGGNGGGTLAAELAKTGASVAGQYLPQMANMYQQGAQQEIGNWGAQNQANLQAGGLGASLYGQQNQANLGYGQLGGNLYGMAGNQALGFGSQALQGYGMGVNDLGQGAAQQTQNYQAQNQANLGYGGLGANIYGMENNANLGLGSLGNNMYGNYNQANLGYGGLGSNVYGQEANSALNFGNQAGNLYNAGVNNLGQAAQTGGYLFGQQNQANLGYGNLANNMWTNAANNQYNLGSAYAQFNNNAANTQTAALAQAQMSPANNYFQNQLTMSGY
ncbi:MAG TPA: hypothetical protein VIY48_22115 [Candidatus Paceibacterota bacterium]